MLHQIDEFLTTVEGYWWAYLLIAFVLFVAQVTYLRLRKGYPKYTWREDATIMPVMMLISLSWGGLLLIFGVLLALVGMLCLLDVIFVPNRHDIRVIIDHKSTDSS